MIRPKSNYRMLALRQRASIARQRIKSRTVLKSRWENIFPTAWKGK